MIMQRAAIQMKLAAIRPATPAITADATTDKRHAAQPDSASVVTGVQRQLSVPSIDAAAAATNTILPAVTAAGTPATTSAQPILDTDELARQVYAEIKRKLAVERERLRLV